MATTRSVDFLPQIFQTETNKQFLAATLDQLIQEPKFKKTQGYIGRTVGPGINPNDKYVVEPSTTRADYQLEPGVISLEPDTDKIKNAITYPGINDAVQFNGGNETRPDRLYASEYYTWDPFVNFDTFVNFSQYFWLPNGPDAVDVAAVGVPTTDNFVVNRENGVYTFSGVAGNNPVIELVRGGSYTFQVAQNAKETVNYRVSNVGISAYQIDYQSNPTLTLARGNTYVFNLNLNGNYPFWIKTAATTGVGDAYNSGVSRNGALLGLVTFVVPQDAPDTLYYASQTQANMQGVLNIVDGDPGTGPGFWIQAAPGISGKVPTTPNISSRDVLGVVNNGEDLGQITFNVPLKTAQSFYYGLTDFGPVDLICDLKFNQINNVSVEEFISTYGGIDGITNLNGRTLVFTEPLTDAEAGGWQQTTLYDPLPENSTFNAQPGSFDTTFFDQTTDIDPVDRYQLWQISYVIQGAYTYMTLVKINTIPTLNKFRILYGTTYSSTQWYKNNTGEFEQIPLLTAIQDTLYYQDGTDPEIFGRIKLLEQSAVSTIDIDEIIGQTNYTSPNGVVFTNGLKVKFIGDVVPNIFASGTFNLLCTSAEFGTNYITTASTASLYVGEQITFSVPTIGGLAPGSYYIQSIAPNGIQFTVSVQQYGTPVVLSPGAANVTAIVTSDLEYYVAGVGSGPGINERVGFINGQAYFGAFHVHQGQKMTGSQHVSTFHQFIYNTVEQSLANADAGGPAGAPLPLSEIGEILGTGIFLIPVSDFIVPETYVVDNNTTTINAEPDTLDYLTIDRASKDLNPWTRSNRWFHLDVINATAEYNNTTAVFDNAYRAKRPIIEFRPGIRLWNMGTDGKQPVDIVDFEETDAFSNIQGSTGYTVDGYELIDGSRIIFAADEDVDVKNKIYVVSFINPDTVSPLISQPIINLTLASDGVVLVDQSTVCVAGDTQVGLTFWFDGTDWAQAQQKTGVQQAPLFNVYDPTGVSFGDQTKYQSSTFAGSKLFSYAVGDTGILDPVLQFPLQYLNINNVGDIVFENNLYKDTFLYVSDNASITSNISSGSVRDYTQRVAYNREIGWQTAASESQLRQQFKFSYSGATLKLDVQVDDPLNNIPPIKLYVGSVFQAPSTYSYTTTSNSTTITLSKTYVVGDIIEVAALSSQTSQVAFYQVPINLQNNPLNGNSDSFTLGTIRTHYESICENLITVVGTINGANNTRDLGNIVPYGLTILQQSAPLTLAGYFMRSPTFNVFSSLNYNDREYNKFKYQLLDAVTKQNIGFNTTAQVLDTAIEDITLGRVETQPFYWSDMLPSGAVYTTTNYTVSLTSTNTFDTVQVYNYTSSNYLGMNVYLNDVILIRGVDYTVPADGPRIVVSAALTLGDQLTIQEYTATYGSFVPNTPTKMGLYAAYIPGILTQQTSTGFTQVIQGHDGSITPIFGDLRDDVLLEFETRIYNNLKLDGNPVPMTIYDVLPGQFRDTGFTYAEISSVFNEDFLNYVGGNKLDYKSQQYSATNQFTWNYSSAQNKLNNETLLGAWRGIYRYFYDTEQPQYTPWEMLGITEKPSWWELTYGPAPYTSGNTVLWDDLEAGLVNDPIAPYVKTDFVRPGLSQVIPVDDEGNLLSPFDSVVGTYNQTQFQKSWSSGDGGPVEASWWNSSSYPFAVMQVLAVTRPARFFTLFADRDLYRYSEEYGQYLYNERYRLDANGIEVYGDGVSKASYINWIVDYNRQTGVNSTTELTADLKSLDVRLCYRMASFSDKQYIKIYTEKSSPNSTNTALLIPDESYDLLLYKNQPFDRSTYSAVVVQKVVNGYSVFGYGTSLPYFNILESKATGLLQTITSGGVSVRVPTFYTNNVTQVPYGFIFTNETSVCDFLLSYGKLLEREGLTFTDQSNGYGLTWNQMCQEFLYWSQQGWDTNALLNLNPLAMKLTVTRQQAIVDSIRVQTIDNVLLDQNRRELNTRNLNIVRIGNTFSCEPLTDQTLSFIDLKFTTYEHMIVLNNQSVFGDLIYAPITGARQSRLNLICVNTTDWTGQVDAPGFILNQDNVEEWTGLRTYAKGEIVKYKNVYWSALTIVQPSIKFNFGEWTQSDYTQLELELLPNLSNKANQLTNTYDINSANIERDNDLLSYGLIGFRPRQYMAALNLDDVSQVNVYRQFLGSKGTILSAELFSNANLGKEAADYDIYENWAVQRAVYGANANRSFFELRLDRALLNSNPSLVQVVLPGQESKADQPILLSDVWRQSYKLTSPDILPTTTESVTDAALPTAGYVNLNDADITVFDINDLANVNANIDQIGVGTSIWVAKINNYDWNIYRAQAVPGAIQHVCDNLDNTSRVIFSKQHGLVVGDTLIIKFFDVEVNGVYEVVGVPNLTTANIVFQFAGDRVVANGTGLGFTLQTMRVAQASDIINLPYANDILPGGKVWVDNNGSGNWEVLEKQEVFTDVAQISPLVLDATEHFGSSVAQATNRLAMLVGSTRYNHGSGSNTGAVYVYVKNYGDQYSPVSPIADADGVLYLTITGARGFGNSVDFGSQDWAAAGASASWGPNGAGETNSGYATVIYRDPALGQPGVNPYAVWQLLTQPGTTTTTTPGAGEFGYSVVMSLDERWMYIGAPGLNQVHAYGRVDWEQQVIKILGDDSTSSYAIDQTIQIDDDSQLSVTIDGQVQLLGTDYTITLAGGVYTTVVFTTAPAAGTLVNITRIYAKQLDAQTYFDVTQSATSGVGTGAEFTVVRVRNEVGQPGSTSGTVGATTAGSGYAVGNTVTIASASFDGQANIVLTITTINGTGGITGFNIAYAPTSLTAVFSLNELFFTVDNIYSFSVTVNGELYRPNIDYTYNVGTGDITFVTIPAAGTTIVANAQGYFEYVNTLTTTGLTAGDRFGQSVSCSTDGRQAMVGAPDKTINGIIATFNSSGASANGTGSYARVMQNSTSGSGYGAVFSVSFSNNIYTVTVVNGGQDYAVSDTITISGSVIGGISATNDLTITVATLSSYTEAGSVYVFDRNVQRFIYGDDGSTVSFTLLGTPVGPISVIVNNVFFVNEADATVGAPNSFYWDGANTVTIINTDLRTGDVIEIETNEFRLIQEITQATVAEFSNFGESVDLCAYNCSLYVGEPQSSIQIFKGGVVERAVNQSRIYGTTTAGVANPTLTAGHTVRVNNMDVTVPNAWSSLSTYAKNTVVYNLSSGTYTIYVSIQAVPLSTAITNTAYWQSVTTTTVAASVSVRALAAQINVIVPNVSATVNTTGYLTVAVKNSAAAAEFNKLQVAPGSVGTAFATLNFGTFVHTQVIVSPYPVEMAGFGATISIDDTATTLAVGTPNGTLYLITVFDDGTTDFDVGSTIFFSTVDQSGAVYTYDYLPSDSPSVANPGNFVFGQQISNSEVNEYDQFGVALNYTSGVLVVGAPYNDNIEDSAAAFGRVFVFENPDRTPSWTTLREQKPVVDIRLLNSVFTYDRITSATTQFYDFFDPLQGKILGAARQNIDYISGIDPANYNIGPTGINGATWTAEHVGQVWWDISSVRFIDPNQDDIVYASRRWGQVFPGSSIDVYQWILSSVPPSDYAGPGVPQNTLSYSINSRLGRDGIFATEYYFWVRGITSTATQQGKTLSVETVAQYISNPRGSGISYVAPINASTIALYNAGDYIEAFDTVINIEFDREYTNDNVHVEYELIGQDKPDAFLSDNLYRKMQDSFCGVDTFGNLVPDPGLSIAEQYGVQFRPRQSMFVDRFDALKNYLTRANDVLALYPISESGSFNLLNSAEPEPSANSSLWNLRVANLEILGFQNINAVALGYKYLVVSDSNNRGLWTIYTVQANDQAPGTRELLLTRVQGYNTADYWSYINWYRPGYNSSSKIIAEVTNIAALDVLSVTVGSSAKVTANSQGKFEIYLLEDTGWSRVGLEDGTIEFSAELWDYALGRFGFDIEVFDAQYYDQEPVIETRKIIQAINEELFVDDLILERNRALTLMFNYVLSEFSAPEWLVKTSLIDVDHKIRDLAPYQNYRQDNQEFVLDYIQEVKPYHVQIREFNLRYNGFDDFLGTLTDFDLPAYYDTTLEIPQYTSPVLLPYDHGTAEVSNVLSDLPSTSTLWSNFPYNQWYNNHLLTVTSIEMITGRFGTGYTEPPQVIITGDAVEPAEAEATINSLGQVVAVTVTNPGSGYSTIPVVTFDGGNGSGAQAIVRAENAMVRSFSTKIKFDRCQYVTSIYEWSSTATYQTGQMVRYVDKVWMAVSDDSTEVIGPTFDLANWTEVDSGILSGVDRTMGLYVPGVNQPGLELPLLIDGVDYPGVQVYGDYFLGNPVNTDAVFESEFVDPTLGERFTSVNIDGGQFVGLYEGHAPEELVNGAEYDTLDMRVYTRPGSDWQFDGHGFEIATVRYTYDSTITNTYSWSELLEHPVQVLVSNQTTGQDLAQNIDYTVDWVDQTITVIDNVSNGDIINISVYELGGGAQLFRSNYIGNDVDDSVVIPVNASEIQTVAVFLNSANISGITWEPYIDSLDWSLFDSYEKLDVVNNSGSYYRALQNVPAGTDITAVTYWELFVPTTESIVFFNTAIASTDGIALVAFGIEYNTEISAGALELGQTYRIATVGTTNFITVGAAVNTVGTEFTATGTAAGTGTATIAYSWSTAQVDTFVADATIVSSRTLNLDIDSGGTNPANMVVTKNGLRLRPADGIEWISDGSTIEFDLPSRGGYTQQIINAPTDVKVWVNGILQVQSVGLTAGVYSVTVWSGAEDRQVVFVTAPAAGAAILISVNTVADYDVSANSIEIVSPPNLGDVFQVIGWNDTRQQNALTLVFQGPVTTGITVVEPYDSTDFDSGTLSEDPGSFDYSEGTSISVNDFWLQRDNVNPSRLWVTLDGIRQFEGENFVVEGEYLILASGAIGAAQIMVITEFTNSIVPEAMAFRIYQDMRGVQGTYRITAATTTAVSQTLSATADIIYVDNAAALSEPDLPNGIFGVITINGERIMYRVRDTALNFVSSLIRGTAGSGAAEHVTGTPVYDISRGNLLMAEYQDYIVSDTSTGDDSTIIFYAPSIRIFDFEDSAVETSSIEVYVGGIRQYAESNDGSTLITATSQYRWNCIDGGGADYVDVDGNVTHNPLTIEFVVDTNVFPPLLPPVAGVEVTILVRKGVTWYAPGVGTPSDGNALQETNTPAARFLRGL